MNEGQKILVTHPGKLGDLVYSLGAIRALSKELGQKITLLTSRYCYPIKKLLLAQDYIDKVIIDFDYEAKHQHRGYQPHTFQNLPPTMKTYELGYRELDEFDLDNSHLKGYGYFLLNKYYDLNLKEVDAYNLSLPFESEPEDFIVFQGFGETLDVVLGEKKVNSIMLHWAAVLKSTKQRVIALTGARESERYRKFGFETYVSNDLLESSELIKRAKSVVVAQSIVAAIANEMQVERLVLSFFPNAVPTGKYGMQIPLFDESTSNAEFLIKWVNR